MSISREQLLKLHEEVTAKAREVMTRKNHDYAVETDVFRNFRYFGGLGILVRLSDKLARLRSFEENGKFKVEDEKLLDTVIDAINYAVIYLAYKQEQDAHSYYSDEAKAALAQVIRSGPHCMRCDRQADYETISKHGRENLCHRCFSSSDDAFQTVMPLVR